MLEKQESGADRQALSSLSVTGLGDLAKSLMWLSEPTSPTGKSVLGLMESGFSWAETELWSRQINLALFTAGLLDIF